jgi:sugar phosphate isomerase/epimerase
MERFHEDIIACYLYPITLHGYPPEASATPQHLQEFADMGFQSVELEGIHQEHLGQMTGMTEKIRGQAGNLDLQVPVFCVVLPGLCDASDRVRQENLQQFETGCRLARQLGARAVLDNAPIPPWEFPEGLPVTRHYDDEVLSAASLPADLNWDRYWDGLVETFREACRIAGSHGLTYQLHPCHGALVNSTDAFLLFAEAVQSDNLKFNLDTANQFFLKDNLFLSLIRLKDFIDYIHVSDNSGTRVEHLAIGKGRIPWERFFETLDRIGYRGQFGIDIGGAESGVENLEAAYRGAAAFLQDHWFAHQTG